MDKRTVENQDCQKPVVWIINQYTSTPKLGGGGNRSYYFANEFSKSGYDVTLITASYSHVPKRNYPVSSTFHLDTDGDVDLVVVKNIVYESGKSIKRILSMIIFWLKLYFLPLRKLKEPNFIIVSSISLLPILNAIRYKSKFKGRPKIIFEIRDIWPLSLIELGSFKHSNPFVKFLSWVEKKGYAASDYLTSPLPLAYKHFESVLGRSVKFKHISNGVAIDSDVNVKLPKEILDLIPAGKTVVGYCGALGVANAMETIVDLAKLCKDDSLHFVVVGDGYERDSLIESSLGLDNITFVPRIAKGLVQPFLKTCDFVYLAWHDSKLYNFGVSANKTFEYMLSGKPVLMFGNINGSEIEAANCGSVVKENSIAALYSELCNLVSLSQSDREKIGLRGKSYVNKYRSFPYLAGLYIDVFEELSKGNQVRSQSPY